MYLKADWDRDGMAWRAIWQHPILIVGKAPTRPPLKLHHYIVPNPHVEGGISRGDVLDEMEAVRIVAELGGTLA